jgi:ACS family sodium-dependent inorganic phosphate cotransporter
VPRRSFVVALASLAVVIGYTDRVNISVAAVAMREELGWSQTQKGLVLSSFFVGYLLFMFASGWLAARYGGRRVLAGSVLAWSILTLLTPMAARVSTATLLAARVGMGIGEAGTFPAAYEMFGRWVPPAERVRATSRLFSGIPVGTVVGLLASGWVVGQFGWPSAFYLFGPLGLAWVALWLQLVGEDPATDARVGEEERAILRAPAAARGDGVPYRRLLLRAPALAIVVSHFTSNWCLYVLLAWLPSYFRDAQHLGIASAGFFSAAPWVATFVVAQIGTRVSEAMLARGTSVTRVRIVMQCGSLLGSAAFLLAARSAESPASAVVLVSGAAGALGLTYCGYAPGILDVAPRHSAILGGFSNTLATIPGVAGVAVTGWLVDLTGSYAVGFALTAAFCTVGAVVFGLFFEARPLLEEA